LNYLLALEAATPTASLAVLTAGGELVAEVTFAARRTLAQRLLPVLDGLLHAVDLDPRAIDALAVGLGPGSFTSLRVVMATAKGIAAGTEMAVLGVGSLEVLAAGVPLAARVPVCAVIAAPKRHVYAALYARLGDDRFNCLFGPELLPVEELARRLGVVAQETVIAGALAPADRDVLAGAGVSFVPPVHHAPRAAVLGQLALARLAAGERHEARTLTPLYLHASEPETKLGRAFAKSAGPADD
jgi:tRNA threonylcarbamoyl adenosine modification protein YeaZ